MLVQVILSRFPSAIYKMKSLNTLTVIAIVACALAGGVGCKKTPKNVTSIPRMNQAPIGDQDRMTPLPGPQTGKGPGAGGTLTDSGINSKGLGDTSGTTSTPFNPETAGEQKVRLNPDNFNEDTATLAAETVHFEYDRSTVKSSEVPKVQRVATYLKNQPNAMLRVEGNCDERGTEEYNRSLGERHALAVRELHVSSGITPDRVSTVTYGEDKPAVPAHDEAAWGKNRRADFVVLTPKTTQ